MNEFLNPKSMMTPGAAGGTVMVLTNAFVGQFPEVPARWVALLLSVCLAIILLQFSAEKMMQKIMFGMINALIIFSVGVGSANVTHNLSQGRPNTDSVLNSVMDVMVPSAYAQTSSNIVIETDDMPTVENMADIRKFMEEQNQAILKLQLENERMRDAMTSTNATNLPAVTNMVIITPAETKALEEKQKKAEKLLKDFEKEQEKELYAPRQRSGFFKAW